jgi:putative PIN family toxin of toxin-antitoxin system
MLRLRSRPIEQKSEPIVRVVADTNTVISGLFWHGSPRQVLNAARNNLITLYTSDELLAELQDVLSRTKFARLLAHHHTSSEELASEYAALVNTVIAAPIPPTVVADLDDDAVLACAVAAQAEAIVSGDDHLLSLGAFQGITILTAAKLLDQITPPPATTP